MKLFSFRAFIFFGVLVFLGPIQLSWAAETKNLKEAQADEQRAFDFIEAEDWCNATNAFLDAYEKAPIIDYLFNAAKAARLAGDRRQAMQLNIELLGQFPGSPLTAEVNKNNKDLSDEMTQNGSGLTCPRKKANTPAPLTPATPNTSSTASPPTPPTQTVPSAPPADLPPPPAEASNGPDGLTIGVLAAGSALTVAGIWGVYWGATSYFRGIEIFNDSEANPDDPLLALEYENHQENYENSDRPILILGSGALTAGMMALGLGTWWYLSLPQE
jgi:hypothetical protein